jgi:coatomer subunit beta
VRSLHTLGVKFPDLAQTIVPQLMEFLSDLSDDSKSAINVILFVREAFESLPAMRSEMLSKLLEAFGLIKSDRVVRAALWILGEYATTRGDIEGTMKEILNAIGPLPIVDHELREAAEAEAEAENGPSAPQVVTRTRITADGTYATESVYTSLETSKKERPSLRQMFLDGEFFVATSLAACLTKLALRFGTLDGVSASDANAFKAKAMLVLASILHLGRSGLAQKTMGPDTHARVMTCVRAISSEDEATQRCFLQGCHNAFLQMLAMHKAHIEAGRAEETADKGQKISAQADDLISFRALRSKEDGGLDDDDLDFNISRATGAGDDKDKLSSKLSKVVQLSGFSDPVYVEAYVHVHQYDILLDVLVVNQTADTLQNLTLELATLGDLKLTEKPASFTVGPRGRSSSHFCNIKANVKVSSTESGFIFGSIVYDVSGATSDRNCVILNDIHIDILDYITPTACTDVKFRDMWSAFEWENKVWAGGGLAGWAAGDGQPHLT